MKKSELRIKYKKLRKTLSQDEVLSLSEKIFNNFLAEFKIKRNQKIYCYLSNLEKNEVNTAVFIEFCLKNEIRVYVPKVFEGKLISVEVLPETDYFIGSYGITEPISSVDSGEKNFDFVITPLLYCDGMGNRVGYGKGFYDYFFKNLNSETLKIGVNYFSPQEIIDDVWEEDIPLDYLVTPTEVLSFLGFTSKSTK